MQLTISIGGQDYTVLRSKFGKWFQLEQLKTNLSKAAERRDFTGISSCISSYVSAACGINNLDVAVWYEVAKAYQELLQLNSITSDLPFLHYPDREPSEEPWDYSGRDWYYIVHLLASRYGWSVQQIEELDLDDGMSLLQEVLIDEQLKREWEWTLSPNSIGYNPATKTSVHHPLSRPMWMLPEPKKIPKFTIQRDFLPVGNIIDISGMAKKTDD